jgi:hypothetical protein
VDGLCLKMCEMRYLVTHEEDCTQLD